VFGEGGGAALAEQIGVPLVARIRSSRRCRKVATTAHPPRSPRPTHPQGRRSTRWRPARRRAHAADRDERLHRAPARPDPTGCCRRTQPGHVARARDVVQLGSASTTRPRSRDAPRSRRRCRN
jgi:hypothetical protein